MVATSNVDVFKFLWSSATSTQPIVQWGIVAGQYTHTVKATTETIDKGLLCGAPANTIGKDL